MHSGIMRRLVLGFGANMLGQMVTIGVQLIGVPVLLYCWHTHLYGEWLILFAIPAYLAMSNLGFSMSAANDMTQLVARGERTHALIVFQSLFALLSAIFVALLVIICLCVFFLPIGHWWKSPDLSLFDTRLVILFLCAEFLFHLLDGVNHAGFRSNGDYPLHTALVTSIYGIQNLCLWGAALAGFGLPGAALAYFLVRMVGTLSCSIYLRIRHPWLQFGYKHSRLSELRRLTKPAIANVGQTLSSALNVQGIVFVVGAQIGPVAVVTLSTLRTLSRFVLQMVSTLFCSLEPELARAYGQGDLALASRIFCQILRVCLWGALLACCALLLVGQYILEFWTHGKVLMNFPLFALLLGTSLAGAYWQSCLALIRAANRHLRIIALYCICSGLAIISAYGLLTSTHWLALVGIPVILTEVVASVYAQYLAARMLHRRPVSLALQIISPVLMIQQTGAVLQKIRSGTRSS